MVIMTMTMIIVRVIYISFLLKVFKNMESRDDGDEDDDIDAIALQ